MGAPVDVVTPFDRAMQALDRAEWKADAARAQRAGVLKAAETHRAEARARRRAKS
jgi:hypothetical protein